jgi:type II secretory pathway pseudopilin PulG
MAASPRSSSLCALRSALCASSAFTLIELMISIALVVFLMAGINTVFTYTTQAVGGGMALATATRDSRAAQATLSQDFSNFVANGSDSTSSACTIITCSAIPAFRNKQDELGSKTGKPLEIDLNGDGTEGDSAVPGEIISPVTYNFRNHRTDTISFFARGLFPRQTGNDGTYVADMSSQEAWIWYGHLWLPDNSGNWLNTNPNTNSTLPGQGGSASVNPNNYYASQFLLGRQAILLRQPTGGHILDKPGGTNQAYFSNLSHGSGSVDSTTATTIETSRYDLAGLTISGMQKFFISYCAANPTNWWDPSHSYLIYNFQANPFVSKPLTSQQMAQSSPIFLQGCSQFMVEFAGDFVTQNNDPNDSNNAVVGTAAVPVASDGTYGDVQSATGDGVVDFVVDKSGDLSAGKTNPALWRRQIRWYGLPRDTDGDGKAVGTSAAGNNGLLDVVPVRDVARTCIYGNLTSFTGFTWESFSSNMSAPLADYANTSSGISPTSGSPSYTVTLGPNNDPRIKMIRITITLDDPNGRLTDGQTYQYVYTLP